MHHYHYTRKYRGPARSICNLKYKVPKQISIVFHNGSNDGYYFIIKQQTEEFEWQFTCLRENTEKYITFSLLVKKEVTRIAKNGKKITKPQNYRLQNIESASSLSNLVNNFAKRIH